MVKTKHRWYPKNGGAGDRLSRVDSPVWIRALSFGLSRSHQVDAAGKARKEHKPEGKYHLSYSLRRKRARPGGSKDQAQRISCEAGKKGTA